MTKNIIFDLGGVLLNLDVQRSTEAFRNMGLEQIDGLFGIGHASGVFKAYEKGEVSDQQFVEAIKTMLTDQVNEDEIIRAWNALLLDFPAERIQLLQRLRNQYRLFLFSNTNGIHLNAFQEIYRNSFEQGSLDELFEKTYYSHIVKIRKPDAAAFQLVLDENDLLPNETLFVDDALVNVEAARALGIQSFHVKPDRSVLDLPL